jgi:xylulokinase
MDSSNLTLTGLGDARQRKWSPLLYEKIGVPLEKLPETYNSTQVIGKVTRMASKETGLAEGTPVITGTNDVNAAALAAGIVKAGQVCVDVGHATNLVACVDRALYLPDLILSDSVFPNLWFTGGIANYTGASLRWFRDTFGISEVLAAQFLNCNPFELMDLEVEKAESGAHNLIFLPNLGPSSTPFENPNTRGVLFGITSETNRSDIIRAIFEGCAYNLQYIIQKATSKGVDISELRITGGGSRSKIWNQITADVTNRTVILPENLAESVLGDAILAGVGVGIYSNIPEAVKDIVKEKLIFEPQVRYHKKFKRLFDIYCRIYKKLSFKFLTSVLLLQEWLCLYNILIAWGSIPRSSAAINKCEKRSEKNIKNFTISKLACFRGK